LEKKSRQSPKPRSSWGGRGGNNVSLPSDIYPTPRIGFFIQVTKSGTVRANLLEFETHESQIVQLVELDPLDRNELEASFLNQLKIAGLKTDEANELTDSWRSAFF